MLFQRAPQSVEIRFKDKKHKQPLSPVGRLANFLSSFLVPPSDSFQEEIKVNQLYSAKGERALTTLRAWEVETPSPSFLLPVGAVGLKALVLTPPSHQRSTKSLSLSAYRERLGITTGRQRMRLCQLRELSPLMGMLSTDAW